MPPANHVAKNIDCLQKPGQKDFLCIHYWPPLDVKKAWPFLKMDEKVTSAYCLSVEGATDAGPAWQCMHRGMPLIQLLAVCRRAAGKAVGRLERPLEGRPSRYAAAANVYRYLLADWHLDHSFQAWSTGAMTARLSLFMVPYRQPRPAARDDGSTSSPRRKPCRPAATKHELYRPAKEVDASITC